MTELIKRYMEETGGRAESFNDIYMPVYQRFLELDYRNNHMAIPVRESQDKEW